jgi:hypothetical protein
MTGDPAHTTITVVLNAGGDALVEDLDALTRQLRNEIEDFGVESVRLATTPNAPAGTKSMEAVTIGALAVTVLPAALPRLIEFLQAWTLRGKDQTVKIKASVGDRSVDVEYPAGASETVVKELIKRMTDTLSPPSAAPQTS